MVASPNATPSLEPTEEDAPPKPTTEEQDESSAPADDDVDESTVDLTDDDLGGDGGLFDGVEDADGDDTLDSIGDGSGSESDGDQDDVFDLDGNAAMLETSINEGAARLACVGLVDEDFEEAKLTKDQLETELGETFAAFRLGHFGSKFVEKYVLAPADGDVDPTWGLLGSVFIAAAFTVWLRPDGTEIVGKGRDAVGGLASEVRA